MGFGRRRELPALDAVCVDLGSAIRSFERVEAIEERV